MNIKQILQTETGAAKVSEIYESLGNKTVVGYNITSPSMLRHSATMLQIKDVISLFNLPLSAPVTRTGSSIRVMLTEAAQSGTNVSTDFHRLFKVVRKVANNIYCVVPRSIVFHTEVLGFCTKHNASLSLSSVTGEVSIYVSFDKDVEL